MKSTILIQFATPEDAAAFLRYYDKTKKTEATVEGPSAGIMCAALRRAEATPPPGKIKLRLSPPKDDDGEGGSTIEVQESTLALAAMELAKQVDSLFGSDFWEDYDFIEAIIAIAQGAKRYERRDFSTPEDNWNLEVVS